MGRDSCAKSFSARDAVGDSSEPSTVTAVAGCGVRVHAPTCPEGSCGRVLVRIERPLW